MKKFFEILKEIIFTFGILVTIFLILTFTIGDKVQGVSNLFSFGKKAISVNTIFQLLILVTIVTFLKTFLSSNFMIKKISRTIRHIILFILIFILLIAMILIFDWFGYENQKPWILTTVAFLISFTVSTVVTELKQKTENQELQDALKKLK